MKSPESMPAAPRQDYETARAALRLLAERKIVPTPAAYADAWKEVSGRAPVAEAPLELLRLLMRELVRAQRMRREDCATVLETAQAGGWSAAADLLERQLRRREGGANWPQCVIDLLRGCDQIHPGWTRARKLEAVARVAEAGVETPELALERLTRLVQSWGAAPELPAPAAPELPAPAAPAAPAAAPHVDLSDEAQDWKAIALRAMGLLAAALPEGSSAHARVQEAGAQLQSAEAGTAAALRSRLIDLDRAVERETLEQQRVRVGLARLLGLLCDNMKTLAPEDAWLAGQLEPIRALLAGPIGADALAAAERTLAQVIAHQSSARRGLAEAKVALREMLGSLIERITAMSDSAGHYYERVGDWARQLEQAEDYTALSRIVQGLLADTHEVRDDMARARHELNESRRRVETYEQRVRDLERELMQVSSLVQRDPLTGALNRRGLEDAFAVEGARAARYDTPLSLLMVDVDRFKALNDRLGHVAGDRALIHLVTVMMAALRPTDAIARVGGEEFAVLLPGSGHDEARSAAERLQLELAARPFEAGGAVHELTFSAGVARWQIDEALEALIDRADIALYRAKRAGRNRVEVEAAEPPLPALPALAP